MKKQILTIIFLFLMFFVSLSFLYKKDTSKTFKIIKVIEADAFYIDINNNNKPDENELYRIKNIIALKPIKNPKTEYYAEKLGISIDEYIKVGYLARNLAKTELTNKEISLVLPDDNKEKYVNISYEGKNLAEILLKDGLAFAYEKSDNPLYFQYQNIKQIKANAKELSILDFSLVNLKTKIAHKINGEHFDLIKNGELFLTKQIKYSNFSHCKYCYKKDKDNETSKINIKKSKNIYQKSIYKKFEEIELFLINPLENKMPTNNCDTKICKRIVEEINNSKNSIDIALYGISKQDEIINALTNAKKRGVNVRAVFDYSNNMDEIYPYSSSFIKEFGAKTDSAKTFMHNKFIIFDNKKVLTGSVNISSSGVGGYNANSAVIITSNDLAKVYKEEFNQMYSGKFSVVKNKIEHSDIFLKESQIKAYFSPKDDIYKNAILPLVQNAKRKIYVSAFYLTDRNLVNELIKAKNRNIEVMIIMDAVGAINFKDRIVSLRSANIPLIVENWGGKNHEKTIMVDEEYLLLGSCNFTINGFYKNDENILLIHSPKIAEFYADYFLYLFNSIDKKYLKFIPRAESFESKNSCYDKIDNNFDGKIDLDDDGCKNK